MQKDKSRLTEYQAYQADEERKATRERIAKEEAMDPLMNGHSPEVAKQLKTQDQVMVELFDLLIAHTPTPPNIEDMPAYLEMHILLTALKEMIKENE